MNHRRLLLLLTWGMRFFGGVTCLAIVGVLMPHAWMNDVHRALGLGELPALPIVKYLTRSTSSLYLYLGVLYLYLSRNPLQHLDLIRFSGWCGVVFALTDFTIGWQAGLPMRWFYNSLFFVSAFSLGAIVLTHQLRAKA